MSAISATFNLIDRMSAPMQNMIGTVNQICTVLERADSKVAGAFNPADLDGARRSLDMIDAQFKTIQADINRAKQNQDGFNRSMRDGQNSASGLSSKIQAMAGTYLGLQGLKKIVSLSDEYAQTTSRINLMTGGLESTNAVMDKIYASAQRSRTGYLETADVVAKLGLRAKDAFSNTDETIQFAENLNKLFVISGASQAEIASASLQLTQALGSGVLRGEELNAVFESAPSVIQTIADYMNIPQGKIRQLAADGQITADIVKNALLGATEEINAQFEQTSITWSQVWTITINKVIKAGEPLLKLINLMAQNWTILSPLVYAVVAAMGAYSITMGIAKAVTTLQALAEARKAAADTMQAGTTFAVTAAQHGLNAALLACPLTWIIIAIAAVIAIFYAVIGIINKLTGKSISATGIIAGAFAVLFTHLYNSFVVPVINAFAMVANFFGNVFKHPVAAVKVLFYDMCITVLGYIVNLAHAIENLINKIPGVEVSITAGLDNFYNGLKDARQQVKDESGWKEYVKSREYTDLALVGKAGYNWGANLFNPDNSGLNDLQGLGAYDMADSLANQADSSAKTADNTARIADNTAQSTNELKYLREIAERQAINRFTNTEVKVDMSGMQNTISSQMDIDGVINTLEVELNESLNRCAEGVS